LPANCTLVAVSKTKPPEIITEAYNCNQLDFGENYVQELIAKHQQLPKDIRWHFIGHLQTNKVKQIISIVHLIHGVDTKKLLLEINKEAAKADIIVKVLLQVYIAQEETKYGLSKEELFEITEEYKNKKYANILIAGLMGMASNTNDKITVKKEFSVIKSHFDILSKQLPNFSILSIGMSSDYELALEVGSTMVRIGSAIFGERVYANK
ncbi:MAG: YggS family pyridoxal phosphate-dependent enzyme, partial [Bacteroidia bacterium]|nr:YggS family pyridoxal phosphate-dependent enzyme [Bacteroidia bacterium]